MVVTTITSVLIVPSTSAFCLNIFLTAAGKSGGKGSFRKGDEPDFDSGFGGGGGRSHWLDILSIPISALVICLKALGLKLASRAEVLALSFWPRLYITEPIPTITNIFFCVKENKLNLQS